MSSALSFAYFTEILYLNISRTSADICRWQTVSLVLFFHGVLCDMPEKIRLKKIKVYPSIQYHVFLVNMHYTLHWLSRLVTKSFVFEMSIIAFNNPSSWFFLSSLKT